jgi:hypothetical protein
MERLTAVMENPKSSDRTVIAAARVLREMDMANIESEKLAQPVPPAVLINMPIQSQAEQGLAEWQQQQRQRIQELAAQAPQSPPNGSSPALTSPTSPTPSE